jgi:Domain of unknown function (DUF4365)
MIQMFYNEVMSEGAKRRSKSQRIGLRGENAFRTAASRTGLVPTKVEEDFGLDFVCAVESPVRGSSTGTIAGLFVGAAVRSSESKRGRVRFTRKDIEYLLSCQIPVFLVLAHVYKVNSEQVYVRLLDTDLALRLAAFLDSDKNEISFTPSDFLSYEKIPALIETAMIPNFLSSVRLAIAKFGLARVLPDVHIELHVSEKGQFSLVRTTDFLAQFDTKDQQDLRIAMFGSPDKMGERLQKLSINRDLFSHLNKLPQPVVIAGSVIERDVELAVGGHENTTKCNFTKRLVGSYFGYVHSSGFSIQISEPVPSDGQMVHLIDAQIDSAIKIHLNKHTDLYNFLRKCTKGHRWGEIGTPHTFLVESCGNLGLFGALALYLWQSRNIAPWLHEDVHLGNAYSNEILNTLALIGILGNAKSLSGIGFLLVDEDDLPTKQARVLLPIIANLGQAGLVIFVSAKCVVILKDNLVAGIKILDILDKISIEKRADIFQKASDEPELVISKGWPVIQLGPSPTIGKSDPSSWGYEALLFSD